MIMIKKMIIFAMVAMIGLEVMAQNAEESVTMVGQLTVPAYKITMDKDVKLVRSAVEARMRDAKLKTRNIEGYVASVEQIIPEIAPVPVNLYAKVEEQGKKKDRVTVVTMCVLTSDLTIDQTEMKKNLRNYLEGTPAYVMRYEASLNMQAEEKNLKQAEKAASVAVSELTGIDKSISSDQKKIKDKQAEIVKLQAKIKDLENEIKGLEQGLEKKGVKRMEAENKVNEKQRDVDARQSEVERYRELTK